MKLLRQLTLIWFGFLMNEAVNASNINCEVDNPALRSMPMSTVTFTRSDGSTFSVQARTANTNKNRAAGFQRVCAETIAKTPILFIFESATTPSFHMNNVVASLDIAFIKNGGGIDSIQSMYPYILISINKPLYSPSGPVIGALEAHPKFYKENDINLESTVTWVLN